MPRGPQQIATILTELMARRGFARVHSARAYDAAWREAAGSLAAEYSAVGSLRRGTLEVIVAHSAMVQELAFQKPSLLRTLSQLLPDQGIKDLRFRVGTVH